MDRSFHLPNCGGGLCCIVCPQVAAQRGFLKAVNLLLDLGAKVDMQNFLMQTALHAAAARGHVDVVRLLTDRGAPVDDCAKNGMTPLMQACKLNHSAVAILLVSPPLVLWSLLWHVFWGRRRVSCEFPKEEQPTFVVMRGGGRETRSLRTHAIPPAFCVPLSWCGLILLALPQVELGANVNQVCEQGDCPLLWCAELGLVDVLERILPLIQDVNIVRSADQSNALHVAVRKSRLEVCGRKAPRLDWVPCL